MRRAYLVNAVFAVTLVGSILCCVFFLGTSQVLALREMQVLPSPVQAIGKVRQGTSVDVTFTLRNNGATDIHVLDLAKSCSCIKSTLSAAIIKPGEVSLLGLTLDIGQRRGDFRTDVILTVKVQGSDNVASLRLTAHGQVDPEYVVEPDVLTFLSDSDGDQDIVLRPRYCPSLKVEAVRCNKKLLTARTDESSDTTRQLIHVAFLHKEYYADAGPAHVIIQTDNQQQPICQIPIRITEQIK